MTVLAGSTAIGASVSRKEDLPLMMGHSKFVGDIAIPGMREVAFLRSPIPSGIVRRLDVPATDRPHVILASDLVELAPMKVDCLIEGFNAAFCRILSGADVSYAGEPVAAAVAPTRARAEDIVARIALDLEGRDPALDITTALSPGRRVVHAGWTDNFHARKTIGSPFTLPDEHREVTVRRQLRTSRQCAAPLECRGILATWDERSSQLVVYLSTQAPHVMRTALSEMLGLAERKIRVVAPAVGGGFGYKGVVLPEEILVCWLAVVRKGTYRWLQDRHENLITSANCREYACDLTAYADKSGRIYGIEGTTLADGGAYSAYPYTACLEGLQLGGLISGPYDISAYCVHAGAVATNKPPAMPFRGTARPGACYATELLIDATARAVGREPWEVRLDNLVSAEQMPYTNVTGKHFDSGDYRKCLMRAVELVEPARIRARQATDVDSATRRGVGFAFYCEHAAYGAAAFISLGLPISPGYETCHVRLLPDGGLEIRTGIQSHGQGLETTLAQVAHTILGVPLDEITVLHGDTAESPYSPGTFGSRCMVVVGGAVANACHDLARRVTAIGAHLLQRAAAETRIVDGQVVGGTASIPLRRIADAFYRRPYELPQDLHPASLDVVGSYRPDPESGTFSYGCHAAVVAVDIDTGAVQIESYVIVSDAGVLINPMIVEGQIHGGLAQGLGSALYEEALVTLSGQPGTFWDYVLPGAAEMPKTTLEHMVTPSPYTSFGQKGMGEGATIPAAAAVANAVNDALAALGIEICQVPVTPARIRAAVAGRGA
jgi:carbon-monoxide dehydrogenase large subunit